MTTQGWVVMVGVRVVDVALLVVWLLWFFRLRDDGDDTGGPGGGGGTGPSSDPPSPGGPRFELPLPDARPWPTRLRDHGSPATRRTYARRGTRRRPARTPAGRPVR
ncbi:MAG: hypothetical protein ACJ76M_17575 [Solirubrobacteraceae bacterium]